MSTIVTEAAMIGARYADNSGLRARLSGRKPESRFIEGELRTYMSEREESKQSRRARKRKL